MNRKLAITIPLLTLLCVALIGGVYAQTRVAGVKGNDHMTYSIKSYWTSNNASEPAPDWLKEWNLTTQYKVMIGLVSGTNVTATHTWDFSNGTQIPYFITIDIESGTPYYLSYNQPPFEGIVGANLNAGDLLHPAGNDSVTINQTITRNYSSGSRPTNVVELSSPIQNETTDANNQTVLQTIGSQDVAYFLDKETGVLVEQTTTLKSISPDDTATVTWKLTETNLWNAAAPADTFLITIVAVVAVVAIVAVIAALVFRKSRKGKKKRR